MIGAAVNLKPDLFKVVIMDSPILDLLTTLLDESMPYTLMQRKEWGNPDTEEEYYRYPLNTFLFMLKNIN